MISQKYWAHERAVVSVRIPLHINRGKNVIKEIRCFQNFGKVREAGSRLGLQE